VIIKRVWRKYVVSGDRQIQPPGNNGTSSSCVVFFLRRILCVVMQNGAGVRFGGEPRAHKNPTKFHALLFLCSFSKSKMR
jgi:hypothetical protein